MRRLISAGLVVAIRAGWLHRRPPIGTPARGIPYRERGTCVPGTGCPDLRRDGLMTRAAPRGRGGRRDDRRREEHRPGRQGPRLLRAGARHARPLTALAIGVALAVTAAPVAAETVPAPPPADLRGTLAAAPAEEKTPADVAGARDGSTARSVPSGHGGGALDVRERERRDRGGRNDEIRSAERLARVRHGRSVPGRSHLRHARRRRTARCAIGPFPEDDGAIPLANPSGLSGASGRCAHRPRSVTARTARDRRRQRRLRLLLHRRRDGGPDVDGRHRCRLHRLRARRRGRRHRHVGRRPRLQRRLARAGQLPPVRVARRRRLRGRRRRLRLVADQSVRLGERWRSHQRRALRHHDVVRLRRGRRRLSRQAAPRRRARRQRRPAPAACCSVLA